MSGCCITDLLVLFTPSVRWNKGGTTATINWINTIVADYNQKLAELGLGSSSMSLKAAKETGWPTFSMPYHENNTNNIGTACVLNTFGSNSFTICDSLVADQFWVSTNSTVANLRNQYSADLVVLITANNQKHPSDFAHGFAGLKNDYELPQEHGTIGANNDCYGTRDCGEFVTVRDSFALSNLTFHHEVGHALGLIHTDGVRSFGFYNSSNYTEQMSNGDHKKPFTIMQVNTASSPICLWSWYTSSAGCEVRLPFYADQFQSRIMYYSAFPVPRNFSPTKHAEPLLMNGMTWLQGRR
jgi:hypothetical protein